MSRILIAEDEPRIASFVAKGLSAGGFTTTIVQDGPSALAHAVGGEHDLLILDVGLPGMDGFEVLRRLRAPLIALVVIYAENRAFDTLYGLFPGANGIPGVNPSAVGTAPPQRDYDGAVLPVLPPVWGGLTAGGQPVALTAGQRRAAGADGGVQAGRQCGQ